MNRIVIAVGGVVLGGVLGAGIVAKFLPPSEVKVTEALYRSCVNGPNYSPDPPATGNGRSGCNRRRIDEFLAAVYDKTFIPPIPEEKSIMSYEEVILQYKGRDK